MAYSISVSLCFCPFPRQDFPHAFLRFSMTVGTLHTAQAYIKSYIKYIHLSLFNRDRYYDSNAWLIINLLGFALMFPTDSTEICSTEICYANRIEFIDLATY